MTADALRRITVLQLHTRYRQPGGEDVVVSDEARLLREAGHAVVEHHTTNPEGSAATAAALVRTTWNRTQAARLKEVLDRWNPDVMHVHNTWFASTPLVFRIARRAGVPVVMTLHNYRLMCVNAMLMRGGTPCEDCVGHTMTSGVVHRCYRGSAALSLAVATTYSAHRLLGTWARDVDLYLALTEFARSKFVSSGLHPSKVIVKPNFAQDPGLRSARPSQSRRLLFVGRLAPEKGSHMLPYLSSLAGPLDLQLDIVGDGPDYERLMASVDPGSTRLHGTLTAEDVQRMMLSCRALVVPSIWYEGFPRVIVEALAAGLPVVASDLGSMSEIVPAAGGVVVPVGDRDGWRAALLDITDDPVIDRAGERARERYELEFSERAALHKLEQAYRRVGVA